MTISRSTKAVKFREALAGGSLAKETVREDTRCRHAHSSCAIDTVGIVRRSAQTFACPEVSMPLVTWSQCSWLVT